MLLICDVVWQIRRHHILVLDSMCIISFSCASSECLSILFFTFVCISIRFNQIFLKFCWVLACIISREWITILYQGMYYLSWYFSVEVNVLSIEIVGSFQANFSSLIWEKWTKHLTYPPDLRPSASTCPSLDRPPLKLGSSFGCTSQNLPSLMSPQSPWYWLRFLLYRSWLDE